MIARSVRLGLGLAGLLGLAGAAAGQETGGDEAARRRGEAVFRASGGCTCHTDLERDGPFLAGGRPIETPFGIVYGTNITPDPKTGLGGWSEEDFVRAMTEGIAPDGTYYYPVFPYTSFTKMTRDDLRDLWAYLRSVPAVERENRPPELGFPWSVRSGLRVWRALYFDPGPFVPDPARSEAWNRGAYLTKAVAHCGECHTPRTALGGLDGERELAGSAEGPEGEVAPNITPDEETGIGSWTETDIAWFLETGFEPDGDDVQGIMAELIEHGYRFMSEEDRRAIATYLKSIPPIRNEVRAEASARAPEPF